MIKMYVQTEIPVRLDSYLRRYYNLLTQGVIEKFLRLGQIKVNKKKIKANFRVVSGNVIELSNEISQFKFSRINKHSSNSYSLSVKLLASKLLSEYLVYQSNDLIAINKPSGLSVQGGSKILFSIADALNYLNRKNNNINKEYKIVHRLDKDTSGILLIAKGYYSAVRITEAFKKRLIDKTYVAICTGYPIKREGKIKSWIGENNYEDQTNNYKKKRIAISQYKVINTINNRSIIKFFPLTGRKHQLRIHSKQIGCPIVGDKKYGVENNKRMLLYATRIVISKMVFGKEIIISIPYFN